MKKMFSKFISFIKNKIKLMPEWFNSLFTQASNQGSKTNIMKPIVWVIGLLLGCCMFFAKNNIWILTYISGGLLILVILCFLVIYFYCLFKNPDLLRSEKYNLEKTALQKMEFKGDSTIIASFNNPDSNYLKFPENNNPEQGGEKIE